MTTSRHHLHHARPGQAEQNTIYWPRTEAQRRNVAQLLGATPVDSSSMDMGRRIAQMKKTISITLEESDWGQIIDGLTCRSEQYEQTADYYEGGYVDGEVLMVRDADEAREQAAWYRRLTRQIRSQLRNKK